MATLQYSLAQPPDINGEISIVEQFWGKKIRPTQVALYRPYFQYYATECRRLRLGLSQDMWQASRMSAKTHEDILLIVRTLWHESASHRPQIRGLLRQHFLETDDSAINHSIDFALRVWLTMNVRDDRLQTPRTPTIRWNDHSSLGDFIANNFPRGSDLSLNMFTATVHFDHTFTAANINRLSGIDIEWTPCLADHLRFDRRRRLLRIYSFKQVICDHMRLEEHSDGDKLSSDRIRSLIPESVLRETLLSLNLLFPHWDSLTDNFMLQHDQTFHLEGPFEDPRPLSLADFDHWRNRLLELHQMFHSPPIGWTQIWADRRNPLQWYTFWIAIVFLVLTVLFGVISSVTGVMQVYLAFRSLEAGQGQTAMTARNLMPDVT